MTRKQKHTRAETYGWTLGQKAPPKTRICTKKLRFQLDMTLDSESTAPPRGTFWPKFGYTKWWRVVWCRQQQLAHSGLGRESLFRLKLGGSKHKASPGEHNMAWICSLNGHFGYDDDHLLRQFISLKRKKKAS